MTENLQADGVQSRQAGFVRCCLNSIPYYNNTALTLCQEESQEKSCPDCSATIDIGQN